MDKYDSRELFFFFFFLKNLHRNCFILVSNSFRNNRCFIRYQRSKINGIYFIALSQHIFIFARLIQLVISKMWKEYSQLRNLKQIFSKCSTVHCRRFEEILSRLFPQTFSPRPDRVWTRLSFVNHASYRVHLHLNANDAFSFSTLFHSYLPCFSPPPSRFHLSSLTFFHLHLVLLFRFITFVYIPDYVAVFVLVLSSIRRFSPFKVFVVSGCFERKKKKKIFFGKDY